MNKVLKFTREKRRHKVCLACSRRLSSKLSKQRGYGPICFSKRPSLGYKELEDAGQLNLFTTKGE